MEPIVYKSLLYIPIALIGGFDAQDVAIVHFFALYHGTFKPCQSGLGLWGFQIYPNNPKMHIWHHAKKLPDHARFGVNFGLTLSIWDYLFGTNHIPKDGRDIELGFPGDENFPKDFVHRIDAFKSKNPNNRNYRKNPTMKFYFSITTLC